jgi:GMP synthase (glutamine-hydrolysing)
LDWHFDWFASLADFVLQSLYSPICLDRIEKKHHFATSTTELCGLEMSHASTTPTVEDPRPLYRILCVSNGPRAPFMRELHGSFADLMRHSVLRARARSQCLGGGAKFVAGSPPLPTPPVQRLLKTPDPAFLECSASRPPTPRSCAASSDDEADAAAPATAPATTVTSPADPSAPTAILRELDAARLEFIELRIFEGHPLPEDVDGYACVLFSGSKFMVSDEPDWVQAASDWIRRHALRAEDEGKPRPPGRVPMMGLCFGHQLLGHALGGVSGYNPRGFEAGSYVIRFRDDAVAMAQADPVVGALYAHTQAHPAAPGAPAGTFWGHEAHAQSVLTLPPGAVSLAESERDAHQLIVFAPMTYGTQFHPEYSRKYMDDLTPTLGWIGSSGGQLNEADYRASLRDTYEASGLLPCFMAQSIRLMRKSAAAAAMEGKPACSS